jgi:hypothetical protein
VPLIKTVDLRDLEDVSKLAVLGRRVPPGSYDKIRLEIELVRADPEEHIFLSEPPNKLPPKIDLNPQGGFDVRRGRLLFVQIDMDAGKAIHIVETGRKLKYQFRQSYSSISSRGRSLASSFCWKASSMRWMTLRALSCCAEPTRFLARSMVLGGHWNPRTTT